MSIDWMALPYRLSSKRHIWDPEKKARLYSSTILRKLEWFIHSSKQLRVLKFERNPQSLKPIREGLERTCEIPIDQQYID